VLELECVVGSFTRGQDLPRVVHSFSATRSVAAARGEGRSTRSSRGGLR
jgi:hypothetical protein